MSSSVRLDSRQWKEPDSWKVALALSVVLYAGVLAAGFASKSDSLLDMIRDGATLAVDRVEPEIQPLEIELAEPPPPPPPEAPPEFIKPEEVPKVVEIPKPKPVPVVIPQPKPTPAPAPKIQYAASPIVMGNRNFPRPLYPMEAKIRRFEGTVVIGIEVVEGKISSVYVVSSSGFAILDSSTTSFIRKNWKFPEGTTRNVTVPVQFSLQS